MHIILEIQSERLQIDYFSFCVGEKWGFGVWSNQFFPDNTEVSLQVADIGMLGGQRGRGEEVVGVIAWLDL